jgi:hypothetical protein
MLADAKKLISKYYSIVDVARLLGGTVGASRYHIKKGTLKKIEIVSMDSVPIVPSQRNHQDILASHLIGIGATTA